MATRAERFKSEQAKEHARQHVEPSAKANGNGAAKADSKVAAKAAKRGKDHVKASTPLTSRELLLNMSPSARHGRRT
jgi:translation initiation factor 2B subunit (eIF-2B alpha/beta/delta family)